MYYHLYCFGGKYDLIQLHRQIIHQNHGISIKDSTGASLISITNWLKSSPQVLLIQNLKKTTKITWHFVIPAVWTSTVFGPRLWLLSACRHSLAAKKYKVLPYDNWNWLMYLPKHSCNESLVTWMIRWACSTTPQSCNLHGQLVWHIQAGPPRPKSIKKIFTNCVGILLLIFITLPGLATWEKSK